MAIAALSAESQRPPCYRLEVGQELAYEGSARFQYHNGSHGTTDKTTFWVTRTNDDGSWHIIARSENTFGQSRGGTDEKVTPGRKEEAFDAFDLHPDGRIINPPQGFQEKNLRGTFIRLPEDWAATKAGWEEAREDGNKSFFRLASQSYPASGKWVFEKSDEGLLNEIYLSTSKALIYFDAKRGLITKVESEYTQGYGFNGKGTGIVELKSDRQKSPDWIAQLSEEAELLLMAKSAVRDVKKAIQQVESLDRITETAEKALRDGRSKVKLPMIIAQFDAQLEDFKSFAQHYADEQKHEDDVLNKAAAEWDTVDIDGKKHSLADYRGKVVVLDFWCRGCGWCIRAMPQIKEVVEHYQDKPVVVLGMNTDRQEKDARFVVDKLKLNYTTLKAEGLPEKYGVRGIPTLVIIDQKGIVRGRHVGYSATLREELVKKIDGLLASQAFR